MPAPDSMHLATSSASAVRANASMPAFSQFVGSAGRPSLLRAMRSAPSFSSVAPTSGFENQDACRGVFPAASRALTSAPASIRAISRSGFRIEAAAACNGVLPFGPRAFGSAPASRQLVTCSAVAFQKKYGEPQPAQSTWPAAGTAQRRKMAALEMNRCIALP